MCVLVVVLIVSSFDLWVQGVVDISSFLERLEIERCNLCCPWEFLFVFVVR